MVTPPEQQVEFFRNRLGRIPSRLEQQAFQTELARLNLNVMWAALKATEAVAQQTKRAPKDPRAAVLAQYERIAAAIAQLFPVFFIFESAWRPYVAARLLLIHGGEGWWHDVRDAVARGDDPYAVSTLGTRPARTEVVKSLVHILGALSQPGRLNTTYELVEEASLSHLEFLIDRHWTEMSHPFSRTIALGTATSQQFGALFKRVRRARNDAYHHRVVSDRAAVLAAAEQLVDLLDIHLETRVMGITNSGLPQLLFKVLKETRHG